MPGVAETDSADVALVPPASVAMSPWLNTGEGNVAGGMHPSNRAFLMMTDPLFPSQVGLTTVDGIFHFRACEIIRACGESVDDVTAKYFEGVHRWLPIISRARFHDRLMVFQKPARPDFSVLLLSMCLITYRLVCVFSRNVGCKRHLGNS